VFHGGLHGLAIPATVIDDTVVRWVSGADAPGLHQAARMMTALSSWWTIQILATVLPLALLALRRWRHLLVTEIVIQLAQLLSRFVSDRSTRPTPFGGALQAGWVASSLPAQQT